MRIKRAVEVLVLSLMLVACVGLAGCGGTWSSGSGSSDGQTAESGDVDEAASGAEDALDNASMLDANDAGADAAGQDAAGADASLGDGSASDAGSQSQNPSTYSVAAFEATTVEGWECDGVYETSMHFVYDSGDSGNMKAEVDINYYDYTNWLGVKDELKYAQRMCSNVSKVKKTEANGLTYSYFFYGKNQYSGVFLADVGKGAGIVVTVSLIEADYAQLFLDGIKIHK